MEETQTKYNPFDKMTFTYDKCFLCGHELTVDNQTEEHVYPKWLQNMFDLWNKELVLLNGTSIKYRHLKIPCCTACNGRMSELFEKPIERSVNGGYDEFIGLDRNTTFLWLNKLSYGMLFKELSLDLSRKEPERGKIFSPEYLRENRMQYLFLQTILTKASYSGSPYSMLIFRIDPCNIENYWAFDNPFLKTFFIRMNDIGIIAHLMDNGFNEAYFLQFPEMERLMHVSLHPIQFAEICGKFLYKSSLFYRNPAYVMVMDDEHKPEMILSPSLSGYGYSDWSQKEYAKTLSYLWEPYGIRMNDIYISDNEVLSFLYDEKGEFIDAQQFNST